jgi:4-amino-4-deoxy-L-arabinose transferase-like glycosyltransferase
MDENKACVMTDAETAPPQISAQPAGVGDSLTRSIIQHERLYLVAALAVFVLAALYNACTTPLWFDEFFTFFLSRFSSIRQLLKAIPADGQPPLQYVLTRLSWSTLGVSQLTIRLPEIMAYVALGLLTYYIVRRHGTAVQALFALALVMGCWANAYLAHTARPYELVLAFAALVYACWQKATSRQEKRLLPLCGITVGIAGAVLSHHFGVVFVGLLLGAGEATRLFQRRRVDRGIMLASVLGLMTLIITAPLARESHIQLGVPVLRSRNFWHSPSAADLLCYRVMVPPILVCLVVLLALLRRSARQRPHNIQSSVPAYEWAGVAALCLTVPVQLMVAAVATNSFVYRYAISASLGIALLAGWGLPHVRVLRVNAKSVLSLATLGFLLFVVSCVALEQAYFPAWRPGLRKKVVPQILADAPGNLPVVVANGLEYPSIWWYSPPLLRKRLVYLSDIRYAETQPYLLTDLSLVGDKNYMPMHTVDYGVFVGDHARFLLLCTGNTKRNWNLERFYKSGMHLQLIAKSGRSELYRVDQDRAAIHMSKIQ